MACVSRTFRALCATAPRRLPAAGGLWRPTLTLVRPTPILSTCATARYFSNSSGTVKMWNEDRGFGFITPNDGGEDVFVHRSGLGEGATISPGDAVSYEGIWDDRKRKYRAGSVEVAAGGGGGGGGGGGDAGAGGGGGGAGASSVTAAPRAAPQEMPTWNSHHIVGSFTDWGINKEQMQESGGALRHRIVVRNNAPEAPGNKQLRREEFQIVGENKWDNRIFPSGGNREEVVVLRPGERGSTAVHDRNKGHGRNWGVEGRAGAAIDVVYDTQTKLVSCEMAFSEAS